MNIKMKNVVVCDINTRTLGNSSVRSRMKEVRRKINLNKYKVLGFVNRTSQVVLEPLHASARDTKGRFAKNRQS